MFLEAGEKVKVKVINSFIDGVLKFDTDTEAIGTFTEVTTCAGTNEYRSVQVYPADLSFLINYLEANEEDVADAVGLRLSFVQDSIEKLKEKVLR